MTRACSLCSAQYEPCGTRGRCLPCRRAYSKAWRARRKADGRPVVSAKMPREYHAAYNADYYARPDIRATRAVLARKRVRDPSERHKWEARWKAQRAIKSGRLVRQPCRDCGSVKVHAHHEDYNKPLDVVWLCETHHRAEHAKVKP